MIHGVFSEVFHLSDIDQTFIHYEISTQGYCNMYASLQHHRMVTWTFQYYNRRYIFLPTNWDQAQEIAAWWAFHHFFILNEVPHARVTGIFIEIMFYWCGYHKFDSLVCTESVVLSEWLNIIQLSILILYFIQGKSVLWFYVSLRRDYFYI